MWRVPGAWCFAFCALAVGWACDQHQAMGQLPSVVQVEEEWELQLAQPDPNTASPQVSCTISPFGHLDGWYAVWTVNYGNVPDFVPGGVQLQLWNQDRCVAVASWKSGVVLSRQNERLGWTLRMRKVDGRLVFDVAGGTSDSWGRFGPEVGLSHETSSFPDDLSNYDVNLSVQNAEVGYAGNRVQSLTLKRVRITFSDGTILEDNAPRKVHQLAN